MRRQLLLLAAAALMAVPASTLMAQTVPDRDTTVSVDPDTKYATALLKPGSEAPDFALSTPDGKTVRLSDLRGHYVVLDFWASWCPDCRKDAPAIVRLNETYGARGVRFVGVSFDTDRDAWQRAIDRLGITYTQVSELKKWKTTAVSKAYAVQWIPTVYLIDPEGRVLLATVVSDKVAAELAKIFPSCDERTEDVTAGCCGR